MITIKRIRVNFQVRFDFHKELNDFIKKLPKDQVQTKMEPIMVGNETKEDWFKVCNIAGLSKIIAFANDNNIAIQYTNVKESDIEKIENFAKNKKESKEAALKIKEEGIDLSTYDTSFMKLQPYEYQKIGAAFCEASNGRALIGDQPGVGKSVKINELIATPNGWTRMGDIKMGDKIFHHDGTAYPVTGIYPQGELDSYKVTFNDDFSVECSLDHLWMVRDVNRRRRGTGWIVKTLKEIMDAGLHYNHNENRAKSNRQPVLKWEIPMVQPIQYPAQEYIIDPYILGALIGDGSMCNFKTLISIPDFQLETKTHIENVLPDSLMFTKHDQVCPQYNIVQKIRTPINIFNREIKQLGLNIKSGQKFIPKNYLIGTVEQRIELLQGLMDTDGSALNNRINYHTTSKQLAYDVAELVQSLGGQAIVNYYNRDHQNKSSEWRVNVRLNICPFKLSDKIKHWWPAKRNYASRYIKNVELTGKEAMQCISVDSPDHTYVVKHYIVTHNTLTAILYSVKNNLKTLIVCPASLKLNWRNEILKFSHEKAFIYKYKPSKKEKAEGVVNYSPEESLFHIINYESLRTYLKFNVSHKCNYCNWEETSKVRKYKECPSCFKEKTVKSRNVDLESHSDKTGSELVPSSYDLVVLDEAHYIKESTTNITKTVKSALKVVPKKILLTGTAIKNRPYEFFSLLNFLDEYEWVNAHQFGVKYCDGHEDEYGHWDYKGYSNLPELFDRISYLFLRRLKKDVLKFLPPKTFTIIPIELTSEESRQYKRIEDDIIDETDEKDEKITHLARVQKLKQFTSKLNAERAIEFIQNIIDGDQKIVVFSQFISTTDFIYNTFKDSAVLFNGSKSSSEKQAAVDKFMNDENCKVFVGTSAAYVGITLTSANIALFIDHAWDPSTREQAEDRIHRASQKADNIQIMRLIAQGTIDEDINELLDMKEKITSQVMDGHETVSKTELSIFDDLLKRLLEKKKKKIS